MDFPTPAGERLRRTRLAASAPWVAAAFVFVAAAARADVYGGVEIGAKGVKAAVIDATGGADGFHVRTLMSATKNTTPAAGLASTGKFDAAALKDTAEAVAAFADQMRKDHMVPAERIYVVGSSGLLAALGSDKDAVRANRQILEDAVQTASGLKMTFIDARREVELSVEGTIPTKYADSALLLDVGSGNTKGGFRGPGSDCVSMSVPYGSVTFADLIKKRSEKTAFPDEAAALREEMLAPALKKAIADKPELAKRERVYLSGGAVWALATLVRPGDRGDYVALTPEDIDAYRALLRKDAGAFPAPDLSGIADAATREAAEKEIAQVKTVFKPEQLLAGAELLKALSDEFGFGKDKKVFFARDAQVGWILAYVVEKAGPK